MVVLNELDIGCYLRNLNMFLKLMYHSLMFCKFCIHLHHHFKPEIVNDIISDFPSSGVFVL